jgi:uncharacterized Tic20 family protein
MHQITETKDNTTYINQNLGDLDFYEQKRSEDNLLAALSHQLGLLMWFIGPLIIYLLSDEGFVKEHAGESLSWQINVSIYVILSILLVPIEIGSIMLIMIIIINTSLTVVASIRAVHGRYWKYPFSFSYF